MLYRKIATVGFGYLPFAVVDMTFVYDEYKIQAIPIIIALSIVAFTAMFGYLFSEQNDSILHPVNGKSVSYANAPVMPSIIPMILMINVYYFTGPPIPLALIINPTIWSIFAPNIFTFAWNLYGCHVYEIPSANGMLILISKKSLNLQDFQEIKANKITSKIYIVI